MPLFVVPTRESQADIVKRFSLDPATLDVSYPGGQVKQVGYSPKTQKWYGWSHRAVHGWGVGDTVPKHQFPGHPQALRGEGYPGKTGDTITTLAMAKRVAMAFACEVS